MSLILRPYQQVAIDNGRRALAEGVSAVLFVSPTGSGKTVIMASICERAASRGHVCDFMSHRSELNEQAKLKFIEAGIPASSIAVFGRGRIDGNPDAPIRIGSVQTLHRLGGRAARLLFVDEAHRSMAGQHRALITSYREKGARILGFTATPERLDGDSLGDVYERMIIVATTGQLVSEGFIVAPEIWTVRQEDLPSLSGVKSRAGDYAQEELAAAMSRTHITGSIVDHWMARSRKPAMCFAVNRTHSKSIVESFGRRGIKALHIDGSSTRKEREEAMMKLRLGDVMIVSQCELWIEGIDLPEVRCAIMARPTQSLVIHMQTMGRVMRAYKGLPSMILDHAGNVPRLGLPTDEREWTLVPGKRKHASVAKAKACPSCYLVLAVNCASCPSCGVTFGEEKTERMIRTKREELVLLKEQELWAQRHKRWLAYWNEAWNHKDPAAYVGKKFVEKYHVSPKPEWQPPPRPEGTEVEQAWVMKMAKAAHFNGMSWSQIEAMFEQRFGHKRKA